MKMLSLRFLASIAAVTLASAIFAPGSYAVDEAEKSSLSSETDSEAAAEDKAESKTSGKEEKKAKTDKKAKEEKVEPSAAELAAQAAVQERARLLKAMHTPFNSAVPESGSESASLESSSRLNSALGRGLSRRLAAYRVFLPGKLFIGKAADFVVKGRPGSQVAIAMADKDSGAKPLYGQVLRLGADRKLVAAGTIPESGILTLTVDMPIQGDLIGLPVYFETAVWQKPDFSDLEIASPVKSETSSEIEAKVNAVLVDGEKAQKRGLRFVPDSGVPMYQRGNVSLESGKP
ncbi:MAG: hypothetical protein K2X27_02770 [Candidatus Obscuribacterales bacterium]|nr:hypothetical protein [Candidatus Obscuribacterales bacterium]